MDPVERIETVGVVGAGVMGAGIAAQIANAGVPVVLLDIVPGGAAQAVERLLKTEPASLMTPRAARLISTGSSEDDLALLADCDWIVEVVVERPAVKQALYRRLAAIRKPGAILSSNTSTIPLATLTEGMDPGLARHFLITHFFNPPRYMRLLERVTGPHTDARAAQVVTDFCDRALGKTVVACNDRTGFIANRLGTLWLQAAVTAAIEAGLSVEEADAVMGKPFGIPKTGVFGLLDLIGLDLMPQINASMERSLGPDDLFHTVNRPLPLIERMIAEGHTGRKGKGGFYKLERGAGGARTKFAIDLDTGIYRLERRADLPIIAAAARDPRLLLEEDSTVGRYSARVMLPTLAYAASLVPETTDEIVAIDTAMRLGYGWRYGPFELIDRLGAPWLVARLQAAGLAVPPLLHAIGARSFYRVAEGQRHVFGLDGAYHPVTRAPGVLLLEDIKSATAPLLKNASAALWDIGDGVACFEFTSKANSLDEPILTLLTQAMALVEQRMRALVIYNEGVNFSVGANIGLALFAANIAAWSDIEALVTGGQMVCTALRYASFPIVAAPAGMALGGGCEILLHCAAVQAHAELYTGLVETGVGLIPGWGGCKEMLGRWSSAGALPHGPMPAAARVFEMVSTATVSKSAAEAKNLLFLRDQDGITMNRDRLLADAKARALAMVETYQKPQPRQIPLPGPAGRLGMMMAAEGMARRGIATAHDLVVVGHLATVLSGGDTDAIDPVPEDQLLALERQEFLQLVRTSGTLARIEHMLETGKPLRN